MSWKSLVCAGLVCVLASPVMAAPVITVAIGDVVGGNQEWNVSIAPDEATFTADTSLAAEIDFEFAGAFVGATLNDDFWNVDPIDNSGNNPFSGGITDGIWLDEIANGELFIAAGSELYATSAAMPFATITTTGPGGALSWGGNVVLGGTPEEYMSTRIAQEGLNYDGIAGSTGGFPIGDFAGDGTVEGADLSLLLGNWGAAIPPVPAGWNGYQPTAPAVDGDDLSALLGNWGSSGGAGAGLAVAGVPEPTSIVFAAAGLMSLALLRRRQG